MNKSTGDKMESRGKTWETFSKKNWGLDGFANGSWKWGTYQSWPLTSSFSMGWFDIFVALTATVLCTFLYETLLCFFVVSLRKK